MSGHEVAAEWRNKFVEATAELDNLRAEVSRLTTTGDDLLRAILSDPADDTARLVYADYLENDAEPV